MYLKTERSMSKSPKNSNTQMAKHLAEVLSDTYMLMIKTHGYHWNVTGPNFSSLHALFEGQYTELFAAADVLAERIRALDVMAPGSTAAFKHMTSIKEAAEVPPIALAMIKDLVKSNEAVRERIQTAADFADEVDDIASEDFLTQRLEAHDKALWMLKAHLA
jgi:starvation-inducible DNA-binding protein